VQRLTSRPRAGRARGGVCLHAGLRPPVGSAAGRSPAGCSRSTSARVTSRRRRRRQAGARGCKMKCMAVPAWGKRRGLHHPGRRCSCQLSETRVGRSTANPAGTAACTSAEFFTVRAQPSGSHGVLRNAGRRWPNPIVLRGTAYNHHPIRTTTASHRLPARESCLRVAARRLARTLISSLKMW
jgi:hypothetical protein